MKDGTLLTLGAIGTLAALRRGPVSTLAATTRLAVAAGAENRSPPGSSAKAKGDCYRTAGRYAFGHPKVTLAHGRPKGLKSGHAWVEYEEAVPLRDETLKVRMVHDPEHGLTLPADVYYRLGHIDARGIRRYPHDELVGMIAREKHWGPWPRRKGSKAAEPMVAAAHWDEDEQSVYARLESDRETVEDGYADIQVMTAVELRERLAEDYSVPVSEIRARPTRVGWLSGIEIPEALRGKGSGRRLLSAALSALPAEVREVWVVSLPEAWAFYEAFGFEEMDADRRGFLTLGRLRRARDGSWT